MKLGFNRHWTDGQKKHYADKKKMQRKIKSKLLKIHNRRRK
jgi:hypothetical protein